MRKPNIIRVSWIDPAHGGPCYFKITNNVNKEVSEIKSLEGDQCYEKIRGAIKHHIHSFSTESITDFKIDFSDKHQSVGYATVAKSNPKQTQIFADMIMPMSQDYISKFRSALRNLDLR